MTTDLTDALAADRGPRVDYNDTRALQEFEQRLRDSGYGALATILGHGFSAVWDRDAHGDRAVCVEAAQDVERFITDHLAIRCDR